MIPLNEYVSYFREMPEKTGDILKKTIFVTREADFAYQVKDLFDDDFPLLVVVIPSADSFSPDPDNIIEANTCLIYVLKKFDTTSRDVNNFLEQMHDLQQLLHTVKKIMWEDKHRHDAIYPQVHWLHNLDFNQMHTDPEFDYLGCHGWSLSFTLITKGL